MKLVKNRGASFYNSNHGSTVFQILQNDTLVIALRLPTVDMMELEIVYFQPNNGKISHICQIKIQQDFGITKLQQWLNRWGKKYHNCYPCSKLHYAEWNQWTYHCLHCFRSEWHLRFEPAVKNCDTRHLRQVIWEHCEHFNMTHLLVSMNV